MKPDPNYRENHKRALYLTGEISPETVAQLTPQIHALRESTEPITVYINSPGGNVVAADRLRTLIRMPDQDGIPRRLITVVTDEAASAAADFLALGDYAIAYPSASIVYHGTRRPFGGVVTAESARSVASDLQRTNERFALRLADKVIGRIILASGQIGKGLSEYREIPAGDDWPNIEPIVTAQIKELIFDDVLDLARAAMQRQDSIRNLTEAVVAHLNGLPTPPSCESERDIEIFNAVFHQRGSRKILRNGALRRMDCRR